MDPDLAAVIDVVLKVLPMVVAIVAIGVGAPAGLFRTGLERAAVINV